MLAGIAEGYNNASRERARNTRTETSVYGMSSSRAKREIGKFSKSFKTCHEEAEQKFIYKHPEYTWYTKDTESLGPRDFANATRVSGEREAKAIIGYLEEENDCFKRSVYHLSNDNLVGQSILVPMQVAVTEHLIDVAKYADGSITRGSLSSRGAKLANQLKSEASQIRREFSNKRLKARNLARIERLQDENNKLVRQLSQQNYAPVTSYRPVFCHKYYGINTVSCY